MYFSLLCVYLVLNPAASQTLSTVTPGPSRFLDERHLEILANELRTTATGFQINVSQRENDLLSSSGPFPRLVKATTTINVTSNSPLKCIVLLGHSIMHQAETAVNFARESGWQSLGYFFHHLRDDGLNDSYICLEGHLQRVAESAGVVVSRFDFFDAAAVDAVFTVCLTPAYCYENFVGLFERWARSFNQNSLAWILSYDVVLEIEEALSFWYSYVERLNDVEVYGIRPRLLASEPTVEKFEQLYDQLESNRRVMSNSIDLYDAFLSINRSLNSADEDLEDDKTAYDIYQLGASFTRMVRRYKKETFHLIRSRMRRSVPQCSPAAIGKDGRRHFIVSTVEEAPFIFIERDGAGRIVRTTGIMIDALDYIFKELNYTYEVRLAPDGIYGHIDGGTPTGVIGQVYYCKADLGTGALVITSDREAYVEFTYAWQDFGVIIIARRPIKAAPSLTSFLSPFNFDSWLTILATLVFATLSISFLTYLSAKKNEDAAAASTDQPAQPVNDETKDPLRRKLSTASWYFFATALAKSPSGVSRLSTSVLLGGWYFFIWVILSTYTANLAAFLTYQGLKLDIESIDQLALQSEVAYGTVRNTSVEHFFYHSNVEIYRSVGTHFRKFDAHMVDTTMEGILRVKNGTEPYAFIWDSPILNYHVNQPPCNSRLVGRVFNRRGYGIALPKGMPYQDEFNTAVLKLKDSATKHELEHTYISAGGKGGCQPYTEGGAASQSGANPVHSYHILGPFLILILAPMFIAVLFALTKRALAKRGSFQPPA
ncbi:glutamate receptor 4-like [Oscarella lobularis]|uniref:glutamate receptor 4-like n=1 Tax=Oscarella lobularis TaxID=121494 RepID=UPI0033136D2C